MLTINGGDPSSAPGDTLNYDGLATITSAATTGTGTLDVASATQNIDFTTIETLNVANPPQLSIADAIITEGTGGSTILTFMVTLSNGVIQPVSVNVGTGNGSALAGSDYVAGNQTLTFNPGGPLTQTFSVVIQPDNLVELDETHFALLTNASGVSILDGIATGTIVDDDPATVSIDDVTQTESGTFEFTVTLSNPVDDDVTVQIDTQAMSALAGVDYTEIVAGSVTFTAGGPLTQTLIVTVLDETVVENDETFQVILSNPLVNGLADSLRVVIGDGVGVGTIQNDDTALVTVDDVIELEDGTFTFTLTLSNEIAEDVTVRVDTAPQTAGFTDFTTIINQVVTFTAGGPLTQTVTVTVNDDNIVEDNEVFEVRLSDARFAGVVDSSRVVIADDAGLGTIQNNDIAQFTISDVTQLEGTGVFNFTVTLTNPVAALTTVRVNTGVTGIDQAIDAISGVDFTQISGLLLTFAPNGPLSQTVSVQVANDLIVERDETFTVNLSDAQYNGVVDPSRAIITDGSGLGTIVNDDFATVSINDVTQSEGGGPFQFTVTLSHQISEAVTFAVNTSPMTASNADFTAVIGQLVTFAANSAPDATQTVTVMITEDTLVETDETFEVLLSDMPGDPRVTIQDALGLGTILNNDKATLAIADLDVSALESQGFIEFTVTLSNPLEGADQISFQADTISDTARGGDIDYQTLTSEVFTFTSTDSDGDGNPLTQKVRVNVINDDIVELDETFRLLISNARFNGNSDATRVEIDPANRLGTATIQDEAGDTATLTISDVTQTEGGAFVFTVTLNGILGEELQITANTDNGTATSGTDFTPVANQILIFAANGPSVQTQTVTVQVPNDGLIEPTPEDFVVRLDNLRFGGMAGFQRILSGSGAVIGSIEGTGTIIDSTPPAEISFRADSIFVSGMENDGAMSQVLEFTLVRTGSTQDVVTVLVNTSMTNIGLGRDAVAGNDFTPLNDFVVTFGVGDTTATVMIQLSPDIIVEPDETFLVRISDPRVGGVVDQDRVILGIDVLATGTILNDDAATITITDAQINEGDTGTSNLTFTVTLSAPVQGGVTVGYTTMGVTATPGVDFTGVVPLVFTGSMANETQQIVVTVQGDTLTERDELLNIILNAPVAQNATAITIPDNTATGTITNDDSIVVASVDAGGGPHVRVLDQLGNELLSFYAYDASFAGGVRTAVGDVDGDGTPDIITAPGAGRGPQVRVFHGITGAMIRQFDAYLPGMTSGVFVTAGDLNGDGRAEIITSPDMGGGPHVKIFNGADLSVLFQFMAYDPRFMGGVRVATGDVTGDGNLDIITAAGPSGGPAVAVYEVTPGAGTSIVVTEETRFFAFDPFYGGGIYVAAANFGGNAAAEIIVGEGAGSSRVRIFRLAGMTFDTSGVAIPLRQIDVFPGFPGGVRVGTVERVGDDTPDLLAGAGPSGGPRIVVYDGQTILSTPTESQSFFAFSPGFGGGVFVSGTSIPPTSGSPLQLAGNAELSTQIAGQLNGSDLAGLVSAALTRFEQAGLDSQTAERLAQTPIIVRNLAPGLVGLAKSGVVILDDDAAEAGWYIDPTPLTDEEFQASPVFGLQASTNEASGRVDLLSVVLHELGHVLGLDDVPGEMDASSLMAEALPPGVRRLPDEETLDALYADGDLLDALLL